MIIEDKVMTLREVSEYLKVHPSTIYRQLKRGLIPAFKVGSDWRFNIESIDRWRLGQDRPAVEPRMSWSASPR
jgi:excisionase family DNA binding protein